MRLSGCFIAFALLAGSAHVFGQQGVSTAGAARTKYLGALGKLPTAKDVIVEDMINYHRHDIERPRAGASVALDLRWSQSRLTVGQEAILQVGIASTERTDRAELPPLNLTLVIDHSGSMGSADKMNRVKTALQRMMGRLRPSDRVSIVQFDDTAEVVREPLAIGDGTLLASQIGGLTPRGSTNLHAGLMLGYREALKFYRSGGVNRVILLTDGIANQGVTDPGQIADESATYNQKGVDLSTIGVGSSLNFDLLQQLAKSGRGLYHFVADDEDIAKVFDREVQSLVLPIAKEPRLTVKLPSGLKLAGIYGYQPKVEGSSVQIPLDNLNAGVTQVVLMRVQATQAVREPVTAALDYRKAPAGGSEHLGASLRAPAGEGRGEEDPSVAKNVAIARLAQGMRDMAAACDRKQLLQGESILAEAIANVSERYPHLDDPDVARTMKSAQAFQTIIRERNGDLVIGSENGDNLVPNGNFSLGNQGFMCELPYVQPTHNCLWPTNYTIAPTFNAPRLHDLVRDEPFAAPVRTTGSEQVLYANVGGPANVRVWSSTVRVQPHTTYLVRFRAISLSQGQEWVPTFEIRMGESRSEPQAALNQAYATISYVWNSGEHKQIPMSIVRMTIPHGGGLIGIANIEVVKLPNPV